MRIIKHQQEFWFLWVKLRRGRAEFPVCISATTPAECDCEHRAASCLCPQITLWGRIHVVGNSVPLLREKSPAGCLLCCTVRLTSKAGWKKFCGVEVYLMARLTNLLHLFIFLISLLATAVVTDDCRGLGGGILELLIRLVAFGASWLDFFSSCGFSSPWCQQSCTARQESMETILSMSSTLSLYLSVFPRGRLTVIYLFTPVQRSISPSTSLLAFTLHPFIPPESLSAVFLCPSVSACSRSFYFFLLSLLYFHILLFLFSCLPNVLMQNILK